MRWAVARGLLRGNLNASSKESVAAFSTTSVSEHAHKSPPRPLSSVPLPQEVSESKIDIKTAVPGPMTMKLKNDLMNVQQMNTVTLIADFERSFGNYFCDADGNTYLDCFMQIASIPLGYNHPSLQAVISNPKNMASLINRPAGGWFPNDKWVRLVHEVMMSVAPKGMDQIYPMMCGTCSNENAIKLMFLKYMQNKRGDRVDFTKEELESTMLNKAPGAPNLSVLAFKGGFHGRTVGLLSCSNSRPIHGVDIPVLQWPKADFPQYKYPLEEFIRENKAEDERCLATVEEQIEKQTKVGCPVAGIIIEPIQAEGGDNMASKEFFQGLDRIAHKHGISLLMDEVQTGGGSTGKMWCHEHFELEHGPDLMTFSKKMLSGGIYHKSSHRPAQPGRIVNTWVGDPHKLLLLEAVINEIKTQNLLDLSVQAGKVMLDGLKGLQDRYPGLLHGARGLGTFCAIDCPNPVIRDEICNKMRSAGILIGGCGESSIRFRPALIFEPKHAEIMIDKFDEVLAKMK